MNYQIPFNKPFIIDKELDYIEDVVKRGKISGNGYYTKKCQSFFEQKYGFQKCLLTSSCTDALEMCAILANIKEGDEVILPSYTFVSTANSFVLRGAKLVFADSLIENPNMDVSEIENLVTSKTKAIVVVHYAGIAVDMDPIMDLAATNGLMVIEDAAQSINSYYKGRPLGSIGDLATFSFHETKNVISGEGGMLAINNENLIERAEIIWEKGTNRSAFARGEVNKYNWIDIGSSFLPSEITAAFLFSQLENLDKIQDKRLSVWNKYNDSLGLLRNTGVGLLAMPEYATNNAHLFYLLCRSNDERIALIDYLKANGILAVFHYLSLHKSPYYKNLHDGRELPNSDRYTDTLIRLPLFYSLTEGEQNQVIKSVLEFFTSR